MASSIHRKNDIFKRSCKVLENPISLRLLLLMLSTNKSLQAKIILISKVTLFGFLVFYFQIKKKSAHLGDTQSRETKKFISNSFLKFERNLGIDPDYD